MSLKRKAVEDAEQDQVNWASKTVPQLRSELTTRGLSLTGKKAELVGRLEAVEASESVEIAPVEEAGEIKTEEYIDWKSYTVPKLKEELTTRGFSLAGKKADLIARLEADDASRSAEVAAPEQAGEDDAENEEEEADWMSYTIPKLKEELTARSLRVSGKKADLVARLEAHERGEVIDPAPAPKRTKTSNSVIRPGNHNNRQAAAPIPRPRPTASANPARLPAGQDPDMRGPLARDVIVHKHMNRETGERRQRDFVPAPDRQFLAKLWRIRNERMFMLDRRMGQDRKGHVCQIFDIAGSTGNIYKVAIGRSPNCDCMDAVGWFPVVFYTLTNTYPENSRPEVQAHQL
jgi:hypothetical protein